jgi:hypothetical protein
LQTIFLSVTIFFKFNKGEPYDRIKTTTTNEIQTITTGKENNQGSYRDVVSAMSSRRLL